MSMRRSNSGKIIVLEGIDGSGKATQAALLRDSLEQAGISVRKLSYPCYGEKHCSMVEMYLNGEFGANPEDVGAYEASVFYAVDRYGDYMKNWRDFYSSGGIILTDRYTTSNMTCQACKIRDPNSQRKYLEWLQSFEYDILKLPRPDLVIYLDVPAEVSHAAMMSRPALDIHERDINFMKRFRRSGLDVAHLYGWHVLDCSSGGTGLMRDMHAIQQDLFDIIQDFLSGEKEGFAYA